MATSYKSRIDAWLLVLLASAMAVSLVAAVVTLSVRSPAAWAIAAFIAFVGCGLPLWILTTTRYSLEHHHLDVRSGPFKWRIPLKDISSVTPTSSPISSPALSLERLRIDYGRGRSLMISPRDKGQFIHDVHIARGTAAEPKQ